MFCITIAFVRFVDGWLSRVQSPWTEIARGGLFPPIAMDGGENGHADGFSQRAVDRHREGIFLRLECRLDQFNRGREVLPDDPSEQRLVIDEGVGLAPATRLEAFLRTGEFPVFYLHARQRALGGGSRDCADTNTRQVAAAMHRAPQVL